LVKALLHTPKAEWKRIKKDGYLPSVWYPSDHLPVGVHFAVEGLEIADVALTEVSAVGASTEVALTVGASTEAAVAASTNVAVVASMEVCITAVASTSGATEGDSEETACAKALFAMINTPANHVGMNTAGAVEAGETAECKTGSLITPKGETVKSSALVSTRVCVGVTSTNMRVPMTRPVEIKTACLETQSYLHGGSKDGGWQQLIVGAMIDAVRFIGGDSADNARSKTDFAHHKDKEEKGLGRVGDATGEHVVGGDILRDSCNINNPCGVAPADTNTNKRNAAHFFLLRVGVWWGRSGLHWPLAFSASANPPPRPASALLQPGPGELKRAWRCYLL
jgi:hypothetical protein